VFESILTLTMLNLAIQYHRSTLSFSPTYPLYDTRMPLPTDGAAARVVQLINVCQGCVCFMNIHVICYHTC